jgi:hypothetical protein
MNFGCSLGDFVTVGQLAWNVYKSCKEAPDSFANISNEVLSLHIVLKEVELLSEELASDQCVKEIIIVITLIRISLI